MGGDRHPSCASSPSVFCLSNIQLSPLPDATLASSETRIPRNVHGMPVFPAIDLDGMTVAEVRGLLTEYLEANWSASCFVLDVIER
jgi:hypothetical protein